MIDNGTYGDNTNTYGSGSVFEPLNLVPSTDPILTRKGHKVRATREIKRLANAMLEVMREANGIGLAAPQVGLQLSLCVIEWLGKKHILLNPKIVRHSKEWNVAQEGCLSVPGFVGYVPRWNEVTVEYTDTQGNIQRLKARNELARILQHEIDHLNGRLYTDLTKAIMPEEKNV